MTKNHKTNILDDHIKHNNHSTQNIRLNVENLYSNQIGAANLQNANLVGSWGITVINGTIWVANSNTGTVTGIPVATNNYTTPISITVNNTGGTALNPTAIVENNTQAFKITNGFIFVPAVWLVATQNGTINAYNSLVNSTNSVVVVDNQNTGTVYTGLAIADGYLYATDFNGRKIDVFDKNFTFVTSITFDDDCHSIPSGYGPFGISNIGGLLYVSFVRQALTDNLVDQTLRSNGLINIYRPDGEFVERFAADGVLNTPWAIIGAPKFLGLPKGSVLVANHGNGAVNIFDECGRFIGLLENCDGTYILIDGLWGLAVQNNTIYFSAAPNNSTQGLVGSIAATCLFCDENEIDWSRYEPTPYV